VPTNKQRKQTNKEKKSNSKKYKLTFGRVHFQGDFVARLGSGQKVAVFLLQLGISSVLQQSGQNGPGQRDVHHAQIGLIGSKQMKLHSVEIGENNVAESRLLRATKKRKKKKEKKKEEKKKKKKKKRKEREKD
jgi:hypothetical protein